MARGREDMRKKDRRGSDKYYSNTRSGRNYRTSGKYREDGWRPRRYRVLTVSNLLYGLVGFLFIFSFSVVVTLNMRGIYYREIRSQQLSAKTGLSEEVIREEYDTLIDYNLIGKGAKELQFRNFTMSEHGRIHFKEVKRIFMAIQILCGLTGILLFGGMFTKLYRREYGFLRLTSISTLLIPAVLGILAVFNWNTFFVKFHRIFFRNDYWIFDPQTDPVINILPDAFFYHCALAILLFMVLGCILSEGLYRLMRRRG